MKNSENEMSHTDMVFQVLDWLTAGVYFNTEDIQRRCGCSRATASRVLKYLREKRFLTISFDRFKGTYTLEEVEKQSKAEIDRRTKTKNAEKIRLKKHLYYIYGKSWKEHYQEGDTFQ